MQMLDPNKTSIQCFLTTAEYGQSQDLQLQMLPAASGFNKGGGAQEVECWKNGTTVFKNVTIRTVTQEGVDFVTVQEIACELKKYLKCTKDAEPLDAFENAQTGQVTPMKCNRQSMVDPIYGDCYPMERLPQADGSLGVLEANPHVSKCDDHLYGLSGPLLTAKAVDYCIPHGAQW
jgi:hypothetical protein